MESITKSYILRTTVFIFFLLLASVSCIQFFTGCSSDTDSSEERHIDYDSSFFDEENLQYPDQLVIPDKYNTGVDSSVQFSKISESQSVNGVYITLRTDTNQYLVSSYGVNHVENRDGTLKSEMADEITVENYDFSDLPFVIGNGERFSTKKKIVFKNCKFKGFRNPPSENNQVWIEFERCSFCGGVNEAQISLNHCYIGGFTADGMNPTRYFKCKNSYVADLVTDVTSGEVHIDGFQSYGRANIAGGNIYFDNVRFEIPSIHIENQYSGTGVNACVMFQLEFGNVDNCLFKNLFINGGGKWYPIYLTNGKKGKTFSQQNLVLKNAYVSNNFGKIFYSGSYDDKATVENVDHRNSIYVSSVWQSSDGKTHIICSNDTIFKSTLLVKAVLKSDSAESGTADVKEYRFSIARCPSNWNLEGKVNTERTAEQKAAGLVDDEATCLSDENGKSYTEYKFADMPFDMDCVIEDDVSEITCFDEEENVQIRHVKF